MSTEHYFIASDGMLGIRTNLREFKWSFGIRMPEATRAEYDACAVRFRLSVERQLDPPETADAGKYHYFSGAPDADAIEYDRSFVCGSRLRFRVTGLLGDEPTITVNRAYYRFITHRFMNLHSVGYLLTDLAGLLLLHKGIAPLHCSGFRIGDATVMIAAPPNTGKTLTSMMAAMEHGAKFVAEDLALTDGEAVFAVPWTSTFRYYSRIDQSWSSRLHDRLTKAFPPLELVQFRAPQPITDYVDPEQIINRSRATHVVILERGNGGVRPVGIEEAARKVRNLNRYEFNYHKSPLAVAYEFFNPALDLAGACRAEDEILHKLVAGTERLVVQSTDPTQYAQMIIDAVTTGGAGEVGPRRVA